MRPIFAISIGLVAVVGTAVQACSSGSGNSFGFPDSGTSSSGSGSGGNASSGGLSGSSGGSSSGGTSSGLGDSGTVVEDGGDGGITVTNTVYANTDNTLYSVDPSTNATTMIGLMVGTSDGSTDSTVTDVAVDGNGDVYVNTESVVYKATIPAGGTGTVQLTSVAKINSTAKFYALAFAPAGALDPNNETLVGGDSDGNLWSIDTTNGSTINLGNFGTDTSISGNTFELSGDVVFYLDPNNNNAPTGLATIRSCPAGGSGSKCKGDYLAGVNMTNLKAAYSSGTAATTLLGGIYGGSSTGPGNGTGFVDVFGLAAWNSTVFGFSRYTSTAAATLLTIDTTSGVGTAVKTFTFPGNDGWSGAGVSTKVSISVPKPPPPPAQ